MAVLSLFFIMFSHSAFQNQFTTLLGAKAAGLGGAATSVMGDASSSAYYNPALTVFTSCDNITSSVSIYNKYNSNYGKATSLLEAGKTINQGFFRSIPSATGSVLKYKDWSFTASIIVPDYDFFAGEVNSTTTNSTFLNYTDESIWTGGSAAHKISETSSLGITVYYTSRHLSRSSQNQTIISPTQMIINTEEKNSTHNGIVLNLGYFKIISPTLNLGINLRPPIIPISGNTNYFLSRVDTSSLPGVTTRLENIKSKFQAPFKASLGLSWNPMENFLVSFDIHHFLGQKYFDMESTQGQEMIDFADKTNFALGLQYDLSDPNITMRTGVFSNFSSLKKIPGGPQNYRQPDRIDMLGLAGNLSFKTHDKVEYTLGGYFNTGVGTSVEWIENQLQTISKDQKIFTMLVSAMIEL